MADRRDFFRTLAGLTAGLLAGQAQAKTQTKTAGGAGKAAGRKTRDRWGALLQTRALGATGEWVTMLGVGGWHLGRMKDDATAQETIEVAMAGGVRFFDTAAQYQDGGSESRYGRVLVPKYRDDIFLMTKTQAKDRKSALAELDASLKRLGTDRVDLWQMHDVRNPDDVDARIANGVIDAFVEAKKSGKARYIGFTGHRMTSAHLRVLEKTGVFETCQLPVNVADPGYDSFIEKVVPPLVSKKVGLLAMKTLANGGFFGGSKHGQHGEKPKIVPDRVTIADAIQFVWSLPVSVLITGPDDVGQMKEKIALAKSFGGMDAKKREALVAKVADLAGRQVEFYKA